MRNLKVLLNIKHHNALFANSDLVVLGKQVQSGNLSSKLNDIYCLSNNMIYCVKLDGDKVLELYNLADFFGNQEIQKPINMWYRDLSDTLSICFESGEILSLALMPNGEHQLTSHLLESGVVQICWSPDEEFAIVNSDADNFYLINSEFSMVSDINLYDSRPGEKQLINVGWGKKETQFHGSEGKKAALASQISISGSLVEDSHQLKMTWRGDSNLFAIGYWCLEKNMRLVKIFNNEGSLQCVSEEIQGLQEPLFWKPQGNLITFSQQLPNKLVIAFMEKNGLKHGEFTLPNGLKVKDVCWNEASTILCTICENKDTQDEEILLWTTGNYHWYLKQKFKLKTQSRNIWWDKERPNRLYILLRSGDLHIFEWTFAVDSSYNSANEHLSNVAVIDGDEVLITSFKEAIVPPPLCSFKLKCPSAVNQVIFPPLQSDASLVICAILCNGSVAIFKESNPEPLVFSTNQLDNADFSDKMLSLAHWEWVNENILLVCVSEKNRSIIHHLLLEESNLCLRNSVSIEGIIITCTRSQGKAIIQTSEGKLINYNVESMVVGSEGFSFVEPSCHVKIHSTGLYCLSEWGRLYVNGLQILLPSISGNVTSFLLRDPYILLTTSSHKLVILQFNYKNHEPSERKLERGSRLVTVCGNLVILQTPRGNLETIQPRALTVLTAGELIDAKMYKEALCLLRKQRIDLNLLVDHNQNAFITDTPNFIQDVDPQWITLLITELSNEDVTKSLYSTYYKPEYRPNKTLNGTKVKTVCENLVDAMSRNDETKKKHALPILSALVKIGEMAKAIKLADTEQALQHLMFIVDVNKVYSEALGAYDLEAALKIAQKSQKDPKEYIPYLNSLRKMEANYMRFTIDKSLNRMSSALTHLSKCSDDHEEECFDFIKENSLFPIALKLFKNDSKRMTTIAQMYGEYLFRERRYEESGIMYLRGGDKEKAIQSFTRAGNWRQCMVIASKENYSDEKRKLIAENMCNMLVSSHKFADAAIMYLEWISNAEKAVELYNQGKCWKEAIYTAEKHNKPELLSLIKESLLEAVDSLMESIGANIKKMTTYVPRLQTVRIEKQNRPAFVYDDFSDTASETSSTSSLRTKSFQSRSSKNTKKMNRKLWSLKEGNPREEEALVATLSQIIQSAEKCVSDVNAVCAVLLTFEEDDVASKLQKVMKDWLQEIEKSKNIIWPRDPEMNEANLFDEKYKHPPEINIMPGWEFHFLRI